MEHIRNNSSSTIDSSDKNVSFSPDSKDEIALNPNFLKTQLTLNTSPTPSIDELVLQFEAEENDCLCSLTQACINHVNHAESDTIWNEFRRWVKSRFGYLREICFGTA